MLPNIQYHCVLKLVAQVFQAGAMKESFLGTVEESVPTLLIKQFVQNANKANEQTVSFYISQFNIQ